ncbi:MAG: ABC transporter permease subunit [Planctomycetota bacterium]
MLALRQFRHEIYKLFARKRSYIGFGAFVLLQITLLACLQLPRPKREIGQLLKRNGLVFDEYYQGLTLAIVIIAFTFTLLGALYVALVGGDIVAKEVEDGTMRMVLCRPISRFRLLTLKMAACVTYTILLVLFLGVTALLISTVYRGGLGKLFIFISEEDLFAFYNTGPGLWRYARSVVCLAYATVVIAALAFMFSCFNVKPAAATILTLSFFMGDLVLQNLPYFQSIRHYFVTYHFAFWVRTYHDPVPWHAIATSVIYLTTLTLTFWLIGVTRFCTRDLKR